MARPRKNNADYFSHDNNMRNHRKIKALRNTFGMEGYGVFNMFLETQTESDKCKIKLSNNIEWEILAADFSVECQKLKDIMEYCIKIALIEKEGDYYFSENLIERLSPILELREKKREWANKRWDNDTETELKTPKTELKTSESMQTKLNKTKLNKTKDIIYSDLAVAGIDKVLNIFYNINPTLNWGNKTTRTAASDLIKKFTLEGTLKMAEQVVAVQGKPYAPVATTPYQMKEKLAQFKIYFDKEKTNQPKTLKL